MVHELTLNLVYVFLLHLITSLIPQIDTPSRPSNFGLPAFLLSSLPSFLPSFLRPPTSTLIHTRRVVFKRRFLQMDQPVLTQLNLKLKKKTIPSYNIYVK